MFVPTNSELFIWIRFHHDFVWLLAGTLTQSCQRWMDKIKMVAHMDMAFIFTSCFYLYFACADMHDCAHWKLNYFQSYESRIFPFYQSWAKEWIVCKKYVHILHAFAKYWTLWAGTWFKSFLWNLLKSCWRERYMD